MKPGTAALLLIAAILQASLSTALVTEHYALALEIGLFGCLLIWAVLAFFARDLLSSGREPLPPRLLKAVEERYARYGVYAMPVANDLFSDRHVRVAGRRISVDFLPLLVATLSAATVVGSSFGFALSGDMAMAAAITGSAGLGALVLYCCHTPPATDNVQVADLKRRAGRR
ncbi:hypothetical protein [Rhizobium sp. SGZ-381]|uniref:hypothetical protein n=1 Tax=Rhizobium sp. SGZ-381 TaxID=3342800 RepID=UPI00366B798E